MLRWSTVSMFYMYFSKCCLCKKTTINVGFFCRGWLISSKTKGNMTHFGKAYISLLVFVSAWSIFQTWSNCIVSRKKTSVEPLQIYKCDFPASSNASANEMTVSKRILFQFQQNLQKLDINETHYLQISTNQEECLSS